MLETISIADLLQATGGQQQEPAPTFYTGNVYINKLGGGLGPGPANITETPLGGNLVCQTDAKAAKQLKALGLSGTPLKCTFYQHDPTPEK